MATFFERYFFLALALLCLAPGAAIALARPDLRRVMLRVTPWALPFALTERLFYPEYWQPVFLFDLGDSLGFGIEDLLFVAGLSHLGSTVFAFVARRSLVPNDSALAPAFVGKSSPALARGAGALAAAFASFFVVLALGAPALWASVVAMGVAMAMVARARADLLGPMAAGALLGALVYGALCLVLEALVPGVFARHWRTEGLVGATVLGVPAGELLYGSAATAVATGFYPWAFGLRFESSRRQRVRPDALPA